MSNNDKIYFELTNEDNNIIDKLIYFIKLTRDNERKMHKTKPTILNSVSDYKNYYNVYDHINPNKQINKYVLFNKSFFKTQYTDKSIFTDEGKLINITDKLKNNNNRFSNIDYDYATFFKDYNREVKDINIFVIYNTKYYQINNNYIYDNYYDKVASINTNNYSDTYRIYDKYQEIVNNILRSLINNDNNINNNDTLALNYITTLLYIMLCQADNIYFIINYYLAIYRNNHIYSTLPMYYTNIIIDLNNYNIYKLNNINMNINKNINSQDFCYDYSICNYHIIKGSYIKNNNSGNNINILVYSLSNDNISKYDKNLMLYTRYSNDNYKYNKHINLLKGHIIFLNLN